MLYLIEWNLLYSNEHQHLFEATSQQQAIGSHNYGKGKNTGRKQMNPFLMEPIQRQLYIPFNSYRLNSTIKYMSIPPYRLFYPLFILRYIYRKISNKTFKQ